MGLLRRRLCGRVEGRGPHHARGFTLLELVIVIIIVSILFVIAANRLLVLQATAERAAMMNVLGTLRSAIGMDIAQHVLRQDVDGLVALRGRNPMDWLAQTPHNYAGEASDPVTVQAGSWYFDPTERALVYRVEHAEHFSTSLPGPARARFRIELAYDDNNANGRYDAGRDTVYGLRLAEMEPYRWTE